MSKPPRIGVVAECRPIVTGAWDITATYLPHSYVQSVELSGGAPIVLPSLESYAREPGAALDCLDGLLLIGGVDMDAQLYDAEPHAENEPANRLRDEVELSLARAAIAAGVPLLGVCRGFQVLNVLYGGDLDQHLGDHLDLTPHRDTIGVFQRHSVDIDAGTQLASIAGAGEITIASHHHQGVGRIGASLKVAARAPDGTVEALEDPTQEFCIAVLWHPEETYTENGALLFDALVAHAARYRDGRPRPATEVTA